MRLPDASYERVLLFFLLHEQPRRYREWTLREALRVVKPGGKIVIVDYAMPRWWHPLRYLWRPTARETRAVCTRFVAGGNRRSATPAAGRYNAAEAVVLRRTLSEGCRHWRSYGRQASLSFGLKVVPLNHLLVRLPAEARRSSGF